MPLSARCVRLLPAALLILLAAPGTPGAAPATPGGLDRASLDPAVRAQDDFYGRANGQWLARTPVPEDGLITSAGSELRELTAVRVQALLEAAARHSANDGGPEAQVGAMYAAFLDVAAREALGTRPLMADLDAIRATRSKAELATLMGRSHRDLGGSFFALGIDQDIGRRGHYAVYVGQSGLGLGDPAYYLLPEHRAVRTAYQAYAERLLTLVGWPEPGNAAASILALETRIAEASWSKAAQRDLRKLYNPMSARELATLAPGFDWHEFLSGAGLDEEPRVIVAEYSAVPRIARVYAEAPIDLLRTWLAFTVADSAAPYLSNDFVRAHFDLHHRTLLGERDLPAVERQAVTAVAGGDCVVDPRSCFGTLRFTVGTLFEERTLPPPARARVDAIVRGVTDALRARLRHCDWLAPATAAEAIAKLDATRIKVGGPSRPRTPVGIAIDRADLVGDVRRAARADWDALLARRGAPVDPAQWLVTPQTVDVQHGQFGDVVFPAALLQPPLFDPSADDATNYGRLGSFIAHELVHLVDEEGRWSDATGQPRDWWTPADAAAYRTRALALAAQRHAAEAEKPGADAMRTSTEDVADLASVLVALDAYHAAHPGRAASMSDGLSADQRLLLAYAQLQREIASEATMQRRAAGATQSSGRDRVNRTVGNIDAWYDAFGVRPGDRLYLAPGDRVRIF